MSIKAWNDEQEQELIQLYTEEKKKDVADSFRVFLDDDEDDDEDESIFGSYRKTKSGQDILDEYKKSFSFGSFF